MKTVPLIDLLDPDFLPWSQPDLRLVGLDVEDRMVDVIYLQKEAFTSRLVMPLGMKGRVRKEVVAAKFPLQANDMVVFFEGTLGSLHLATDFVLGGNICMVSTSCFHLRFKAGVDVESVFCRLLRTWERDFTFRGSKVFCEETFVDSEPMDDASIIVGSLIAAFAHRVEGEKQAAALEMRADAWLHGQHVAA